MQKKVPKALNICRNIVTDINKTGFENIDFKEINGFFET